MKEQNSVILQKKIFISMSLNLTCFYSIFSKKHNSQSHFKYIEKHKIIDVLVVSLFVNPKKFISIE